MLTASLPPSLLPSLGQEIRKGREGLGRASGKEGGIAATQGNVELKQPITFSSVFFFFFFFFFFLVGGVGGEGGGVVAEVLSISLTYGCTKEYYMLFPITYNAEL